MGSWMRPAATGGAPRSQQRRRPCPAVCELASPAALQLWFCRVASHLENPGKPANLPAFFLCALVFAPWPTHCPQ